MKSASDGSRGSGGSGRRSLLALRRLRRAAARRARRNPDGGDGVDRRRSSRTPTRSRATAPTSVAPRPPSATRPARRRRPGEACACDGECASGFCVDGVCCNQRLHRRLQDLQRARTSSGTCVIAHGGRRSRATRRTCVTTPASTCGFDGTCDGAGGCRKYPANTHVQGRARATATRSSARTPATAAGTASRARRASACRSRATRAPAPASTPARQQPVRQRPAVRARAAAARR